MNFHQISYLIYILDKKYFQEFIAIFTSVSPLLAHLSVWVASMTRTFISSVNCDQWQGQGQGQVRACSPDIYTAGPGLRTQHHTSSHSYLETYVKSNRFYPSRLSPAGTNSELWWHMRPCCCAGTQTTVKFETFVSIIPKGRGRRFGVRWKIAGNCECRGREYDDEPQWENSRHSLRRRNNKNATNSRFKI